MKFIKLVSIYCLFIAQIFGSSADVRETDWLRHITPATVPAPLSSHDFWEQVEEVSKPSVILSSYEKLQNNFPVAAYYVNRARQIFQMTNGRDVEVDESAMARLSKEEYAEIFDQGLMQFFEAVTMAFDACDEVLPPLATDATDVEKEDFCLYKLAFRRYADSSLAAVYSSKDIFLMRKLTYLDQMFRICIRYCDKMGYRFDPERDTALAIKDGLEGKFKAEQAKMRATAKGVAIADLPTGGSDGEVLKIGRAHV